MRFRREYAFLSNMYEVPITISVYGTTYTFLCSEAAYQAGKDPTQAESFVDLRGPAAKELGKEISMSWDYLERAEWKERSVIWMREVVKAKFSQHPELMEKLISIKEQIVEDNDWKDSFWGVYNGSGLNMLGKILMEVRGSEVERRSKDFTARNPIIGITERGDAGLDLSWVNSFTSESVDGAILITKNINDAFIYEVLKLTRVYSSKGKVVPIIVHCTVTGWGKTVVEPNVPKYEVQLQQLRNLINSGFPAENCVIRVDPIWPTTNGLRKAVSVIAAAAEIIPEVKRYRVSLLDEYAHVKERMCEAGFSPVYGHRFYPDASVVKEAAHELILHCPFKDQSFVYECCAEIELCKYPMFVAQGCISYMDLTIMGISYNENMAVNGQNRKGCLCLTCKKELLTRKERCPNGCMYCYWKG